MPTDHSHASILPVGTLGSIPVIRTCRSRRQHAQTCGSMSHTSCVGDSKCGSCRCGTMCSDSNNVYSIHRHISQHHGCMACSPTLLHSHCAPHEDSVLRQATAAAVVHGVGGRVAAGHGNHLCSHVLPLAAQLPGARCRAALSSWPSFSDRKQADFMAVGGGLSGPATMRVSGGGAAAAWLMVHMTSCCVWQCEAGGCRNGSHSLVHPWQVGLRFLHVSSAGYG